MDIEKLSDSELLSMKSDVEKQVSKFKTRQNAFKTLGNSL